MVPIQRQLQEKLIDFLRDNPDGISILAREFSVSRSTVKRWRDGVTAPHPQMCPIVIDYLGRK